MLQYAGHSQILTKAALRNRVLLLEEEIASKIVQGDEDACGW